MCFNLTVRLAIKTDYIIHIITSGKKCIPIPNGLIKPHTHTHTHWLSLANEKITFTLMTLQSQSNKSLCWLSQTCSAGASQHWSRPFRLGTSWIFRGLFKHSLSCYTLKQGHTVLLVLFPLNSNGIMWWKQFHAGLSHDILLWNILVQTKIWPTVTRVSHTQLLNTNLPHFFQHSFLFYYNILESYIVQ